MRKIHFFCHNCRMHLEAPEEYAGLESTCPGCGVALTCPAATHDNSNETQMDLSDDRLASLSRWLEAIEPCTIGGIVFTCIAWLNEAITPHLIIGSIVAYAASLLLVRGIKMGAKWARVSVYAISMSYLPFAFAEDTSVNQWIALVLMWLSAAQLLLPKVNSSLKLLGEGRSPRKLACYLFWIMIATSLVLKIMSPDTRGFASLQAECGSDMPLWDIIEKPIGFAISYLNMLLGHAYRRIDGGVGKTSSRTRCVSCPKCGTEITVFDMDDNDLETCPSCGEAFYPFGMSGLAHATALTAVFSILILPGPFVLALGLLALRDIKRHRGKHGITMAWVGIVVGGLATAFMLAMAILYVVAMACP